MTQPTVRWKDIAELIGIVAIVASLIFVGLQMRQSQEIAVATQYQERAGMALQYFASQGASNEAISYRYAWLTDSKNPLMTRPEFQEFVESASPEMVVLSYVDFRSNINLLDNYHFQYESGFMLEDAWLAFRSILKRQLSSEPNRSFYLADTARYRSSFKAVCDELLTEQ